MIQLLATFAPASTPETPLDTPTVMDRVARMGEEIDRLSGMHARLAADLGATPTTQTESLFTVLQGYIGVAAVAFVVTLLATPLVRKLAISNGIVDRPSEARKIHRVPIAYLGGVAVYVGLIAGILYSYFAERFPALIDHLEPNAIEHPVVPLWIVGGMTVIMLVGLIDDVWGMHPRLKVGGQLFAAACLAWGQIGTNVAAGVLTPTLGAWLHNPDLTWLIFRETPLIGGPLEFDLIYWTGTAIIAVFVLGSCNAANLIDGLDGLLTGVTSIATTGFLIIARGMSVAVDCDFDWPRVVLCLAVLGACLGFLPHNFNPANIFLGDCGSLLLGYCAAAMILSLGDTGKTFLVLAGLIIYAIPIMDTALAIVRRKLAGKRMSDPDSDHLHHMLKRAFGVKGAVFALYGIGLGFMVLGVLVSTTRARFIYALAAVVIAYIAVYAIKIARREQIEKQALALDTPPEPGAELIAEPGAEPHGQTPDGGAAESAEASHLESPA